MTNGDIITMIAELEVNVQCNIPIGGVLRQKWKQDVTDRLEYIKEQYM